MNIEEKSKEVAKQFAKFGKTMDLNDAILALINEAKEFVKPEKTILSPKTEFPYSLII